MRFDLKGLICQLDFDTLIVLTRRNQKLTASEWGESSGNTTSTASTEWNDPKITKNELRHFCYFRQNKYLLLSKLASRKLTNEKNNSFPMISSGALVVKHLQLYRFGSNLLALPWKSFQIIRIRFIFGRFHNFNIGKTRPFYPLPQTSLNNSSNEVP